MARAPATDPNGDDTEPEAESAPPRATNNTFPVNDDNSNDTGNTAPATRPDAGCWLEAPSGAVAGPVAVTIGVGVDTEVGFGVDITVFCRAGLTVADFTGMSFLVGETARLRLRVAGATTRHAAVDFRTTTLTRTNPALLDRWTRTVCQWECVRIWTRTLRFFPGTFTLVLTTVPGLL